MDRVFHPTRIASVDWTVGPQERQPPGRRTSRRNAPLSVLQVGCCRRALRRQAQLRQYDVASYGCGSGWPVRGSLLLPPEGLSTGADRAERRWAIGTTSDDRQLYGASRKPSTARFGERPAIRSCEVRRRDLDEGEGLNLLVHDIASDATLADGRDDVRPALKCVATGVVFASSQPADEDKGLGRADFVREQLARFFFGEDVYCGRRRYAAVRAVMHLAKHAKGVTMLVRANTSRRLDGLSLSRIVSSAPPTLQCGTKTWRLAGLDRRSAWNVSDRLAHDERTQLGSATTHGCSRHRRRATPTVPPTYSAIVTLSRRFSYRSDLLDQLQGPILVASAARAYYLVLDPGLLAGREVRQPLDQDASPPRGEARWPRLRSQIPWITLMIPCTSTLRASDCPESLMSADSQPDALDVSFPTRVILAIVRRQVTNRRPLLNSLSILEPRRFNELQSRSGFSKKILVQTLRTHLERDGLLERTVYHQVPPKEYRLTYMVQREEPSLGFLRVGHDNREFI